MNPETTAGTVTAAPVSLTPDWYAKTACAQPRLMFEVAYDSRGVDLTDPRWTRWLVGTAGPTATVLVVEIARELATTDRYEIPPSLLAAFLGVGRNRLAVAIARAIRFRILFPLPSGAFGLDIRPTPPPDPTPWPHQ